ncbi:MAG: methionyl-tRNA formyltransferase [Cyclobacteriaceae bacterium]|nr:methionyl-tRNA formyltransferase [Cyclobacteriaceae bacterium]
MKELKDLRIVFMGTPEFAVASLEALVNEGLNIVGVITAPDKPQGRGRQLAVSPVKEFAVAHGLHVLQPTNLKSDEFLKELESLKADLQIVVAFRMLPEAVWNMPPIGTFNLHASLLPQYRGAAPINWAIINGETETGVTTFFLQHEIDTGNILLQEKEPIHPNDNVGSLYERLMAKGAGLVVKTVKLIQSEKVVPQPQLQVENMKFAPKLYKETCEINWEWSAATVHNFVRGLSPYPAAWSVFGDNQFKVFETESEPDKKMKPGQLQSDNKTFIRIGCGNGAVLIKELQMQGKKRMKTEEFLKGNKLIN